MRPGLVAVITGTGTDVGKTWVAAELIGDLRAEAVVVAARKPTQSFSPGDLTDAEVLSRASGESAATVCREERCYPVPMAPPMAAESLGRPSFTIADLSEEIVQSWPPERVDVGLVEGAGGVASPLAGDGDTAALVRELGAGLVVLVATAGLGVINLVRLSCAALAGFDVVVHLNRFDPADPMHTANRDWLADRDRLSVTTSSADLAEAIRSRL